MLDYLHLVDVDGLWMARNCADGVFQSSGFHRCRVEISSSNDESRQDVACLRRTRRLRVAGEPAALVKDLDRLLFNKIRQLGKRVADLVAGTAKVDAVDFADADEIWPVIVTADITLVESIYDWVDRERPEALKAAQCSPLSSSMLKISSFWLGSLIMDPSCRISCESEIRRTTGGWS